MITCCSAVKEAHTADTSYKHVSRFSFAVKVAAVKELHVSDRRDPLLLHRWLVARRTTFAKSTAAAGLTALSRCLWIQDAWRCS